MPRMGHYGGMHGIRRRRLVAMVLLVLLVVGLFLLGRFLQARGIIWAGAFGDIAGFFLAICLAVGPFLIGRLRGPPSGWTGIARAANDLAKALGRELADEDRQRRVNDPYPLPVSWDVTPSAQQAMLLLHDQLAHDHAAAAALKTLGGKFDEILSTFQRVPSRRLVILGSAGAGKSVLVTELARELLAVRENGMPVPVIVSAATWNPASALSDWIADQLVRTHPGLAVEIKATTGEVVSVAKVLGDGGVIPILDGLDELPEKLRGEAIAAINAWGSDMPLVVTSRPGEYLAAVAAAGRAISRAMVVEILPLQISEVKTYLGQATAGNATGRWQAVFDLLKTDSNGPLAAVLTTPLMVWLARTIYERADSDPNELTQDKFLTNREAIERHLLDAFVPSVYANTRHKAWHRWGPKQAQRWLAFLAAYLNKTDSQDLASWRLSNAALGWRPVGFAVRGTLLFAVVWELAFWVIRRHREWRFDARQLPANLSELLLNGPLGRRIFPTVNQVLSSSFPSVRNITRPVVHVISAWPPWNSLAALEIWVTLIALIYGTLSAITEIDGSYNAHNRPRTVRIRPFELARRAAREAWRGVLWMLAITIIVLLAYLVSAPRSETSANPTWHQVVAFFEVHSIWLLLLLAVLWRLTAVPDFLFAPMDISRAINPAKVLQIDRRASVLVELLKKASRAGLMWLCFGSVIAIAYSLYSAVSILCRLLLGGMGSASARFADARIWLAFSRRMPLRAMTFLADAHRRGVFRQSGAVYQFRHIRLQQRISRRHAYLSVRLASPIVQGIDNHKARSGITWWPRFTGPHFESVWIKRFQEAATSMSAHVELGAPTEEIHAEGNGLAQSFDSCDGGWVLCAAPRRPPVLISVPVWEALRRAGSGAKYSHDVGIPVMDNDIPIQGRIIQADAGSFELAGGSWGPARLARDYRDNTWQWQPQVKFSPNRQPLWNKAGTPELVLRAEARIYWVEPCPIVTPQVWQEMTESLSDSKLSHAIAGLSTRLGTALPTIRWHVGPVNTRENHLQSSLTDVITGPDEEFSVSAIVSLLPLRTRRGNGGVIATAEIHVKNVMASRNATLHIGGPYPDNRQPQMSLDELLGILAESWQAVTELLPAVAVEDPGSMLLRDPPAVDLTVSTKSVKDENNIDIRDIIDFSPWSSSRRSPLTNMAVSIVAPLRLDREERQVQIRRAFMFMAQQLRFVNSDTDWMNASTAAFRQQAATWDLNPPE